jgi:AcrR family transcriptional regulator
MTRAAHDEAPDAATHLHATGRRAHPALEFSRHTWSDGHVVMSAPLRAETTRAKPANRRTRRRAEIREKLFQSALSLIMRRGLQQTTVSDITEAADVGKGTFFNYFPTKEHVLVEFYARHRERLEERLRAVRKGQESAIAALETIMARLSEESAESPALVRSFWLAVVSSDDVSRIVMQQLDINNRHIEELCLIGQQQGDLRRDWPAIDLAHAVRDIGFGSALFWALRPGKPLDALLRHNLDLIRAPRTADVALFNGKRRPAASRAHHGTPPRRRAR